MSRFLPVLAAAALCLFVASRAGAQQPEPPSADLGGPAPPAESLSSSASPAALSLPASFSSDGCTWWFDGDYKQCCVQHDVERYLATSWRERRLADRRLAACVWRRPGWWHKPVALVMWTGVKVVHVVIKPAMRGLGLGGSRK